jgi:hypothetical protein
MFVRLQQPRGRRHTGTGTHTLRRLCIMGVRFTGLGFRTSGESSPPPPVPYPFSQGGVREYAVLYGLNFSTEIEAFACSMMMWRGGALNFDAALSMVIDHVSVWWRLDTPCSGRMNRTYNK